MIKDSFVEKKVDEFADKVVGISAPDGSYIYHLTRVKEAFGIGTMSLDDFTEIESGDEWLEETQQWLTTTLSEAIEEGARRERERQYKMQDGSTPDIVFVAMYKDGIYHQEALTPNL